MKIIITFGTDCVFFTVLCVSVSYYVIECWFVYAFFEDFEETISMIDTILHLDGSARQPHMVKRELRAVLKESIIMHNEIFGCVILYFTQAGEIYSVKMLILF